MERMGIGNLSGGASARGAASGGGESWSALVLGVVLLWCRALVQTAAHKVLADQLVEPVYDHVHGHVYRVREPLGIGAAMRLHHYTVQSHHDRAVVAPRVEPFAQPVQAGTGQ